MWKVQQQCISSVYVEEIQADQAVDLTKFGPTI